MSLLNLTATEFFTLFAALGAIITALYLLDRTKRKKVVSTLRFWTPALDPQQRQSRKRMREPWSLVLQLLALLLLLLGIAQLQWGTRVENGRDHVLLLDTSSWTAERAGAGMLLDREKADARQYLDRLPSRDRVMLVRVDALTTPVTPFTANHAQLVKAIADSRPGFSALNIEQALSFAARTQSRSAALAGEIVYIGPGRIADNDRPLPSVPRLRIIPVPARGENCGILHVGVKRSDSQPNSWQAIITLKNYGARRRLVRLKTQYAGTMFTPRGVTLGPGEEKTAEYNFTTDTAGKLVTNIEPGDELPSDDGAALDLPSDAPLRLAVFTARPDVVRPLLETNHRLTARFFAPAEYVPNPPADVVLLDQIGPQQMPGVASLWIEPPSLRSPLPVKQVLPDAVIKGWNAESALTAGLHAKQGIRNAEIFETFEDDIPIASSASGAVIAARPGANGRPKLAVIGFDPLAGDLKFEITTPLLIANLLGWLAPDSLRVSDITAGHVGITTASLDASETAERMRVTDDRGFTVPFAVREQTLELFESRPSVIHIDSRDHARILSLTLPQIGEYQWKPPANAALGLPPVPALRADAIEFWQWLAVFAVLVLLIEWMFFGGHRALRHRAKTQQVRYIKPEQELVSK